MKRGKYIVVFIALLLGLATTVGIYHRNRNGGMTNRSDWCVQEKDCIAEAVYRYEIQNSEGHKSSDLFFLSINRDEDPNSEVLKHLSSSYRVKPVSKSVDQRTVIKDTETGEIGVILRIGEIKKIDQSKIEVPLSVYSGFGDAKGYVYEVVQLEKGWVVINRKFTYET